MAWMDYGNDHDPLNARDHALFFLHPHHGQGSFYHHDYGHVDELISPRRNVNVPHEVAPNPVYARIWAAH